MDKYRYIALSYRQGGYYNTGDNTLCKISLPIKVKKTLLAINYQVEFYKQITMPPQGFGWAIARADNKAEIALLSSAKGDGLHYFCICTAY